MDDKKLKELLEIREQTTGHNRDRLGRIIVGGDDSAKRPADEKPKEP